MILTVPQPAEEAIDITGNVKKKTSIAADAAKQAVEKMVKESINLAEPQLDMEDSEEDEAKKEEKLEWTELH